jgi:uncharacterized membrane protein (UPF0127 family)
MIESDVADSFWKRMVGLSLSKKRNLLFPMPHEANWSLWMFLVRYPIRMIFIDKSKTIVDVKEGRPLSLDIRTWRTYVPKKPCKYVLETPFDLKIHIGDKLDW